MDGWPLLLEIVAVLAASFVLGAIFERLKLGAVIGYIVGGLIVGPTALGVVRSLDVVQGLAELGVALLLFSTGLEFSPLRLRKLGRSILKAGISQILLSIVGFTLVAKGMGLEWRGSVAVGFIVCVSSTAIVLRQLREQGDLDASYGKVSLGVLIMQDIALVPLVLGMTFLASSGTPGVQTPTLTVAIATGLLFTLVLTRFLPRALRSKAMATNRELPILLAMVTCAGAAYAAHSVGISPSLGAFLAGVLLAETSFEHQIRSDVAPMRALFGTVFFASVGMLADLRWIGQNWVTVLLATAFLIVAKTLMNFVAIRPWRATTTHALAAALSLGQVGELGFILLGVASAAKLLTNDAAQLITSVAVGSMLVSPLLVSNASKIAYAVAKRLLPKRTLAREESQLREPPLGGHFVVVGFGTAGRTATRILSEGRYDVLVADLDPRIVKSTVELGATAKVGDATQPDFLEELHLNDALALIVAIPDHRTAGLVVAQARRLAPGLPIVVRSRHHPYAEDLKEAGSDLVIGEEELLGRRLGEEACRLAMGTEDDEVREAP